MKTISIICSTQGRKREKKEYIKCWILKPELVYTVGPRSLVKFSMLYLLYKKGQVLKKSHLDPDQNLSHNKEVFNTMVLILDGNSEHLAHTRRKIRDFSEKKSNM